MQALTIHAYLINKPARMDVYTIGDDLSAPATDKAYIRFINLSPDAPALDLAKTSATTMLITNKAFKNASWIYCRGCRNLHF